MKQCEKCKQMKETVSIRDAWTSRDLHLCHKCCGNLLLKLAEWKDFDLVEEVNFWCGVKESSDS